MEELEHSGSLNLSELCHVIQVYVFVVKTNQGNLKLEITDVKISLTILLPIGLFIFLQ